MGLFDGKAAVVTGGAMGIGGATARRLAAEGASVLIADIADDAARENARRIEAAGGTVRVVHADVARPADVQAMVRAAVDEWGRLDILVQNAFGVGTAYARSQGSALEVSEEGWEEGMAVLTKALFMGAKYGVPEMQKTGGGNIVNVASVHSFLMIPKNLVYEAGKSAVVGMTRQMAIDFGPLGIRVNAVCPGLILTEGSMKHFEDNPGALDFYAQQYPVGRAGAPDDIASAIAFLCSDRASFITGHALVVDGGLSIQLQDDFGARQARYARDHPDAPIA